MKRRKTSGPMDLTRILESPVTAESKGIPADTLPFQLRDAAGHGWNLLNGDLPFPLLVLKQSALEHNTRWMMQFAGCSGVELMPHGKTTMAPQLFSRQLTAGASGITVATEQQAAVAIKYGVPVIMLANQFPTPQSAVRIRRLLHLHPEIEFYCWVDCSSDLKGLAAAAEEVPGEPLKLLLEIGFAGGRTGCRCRAETLTLANAVKRFPRLEAAGVACYEGLLGNEGGTAEAAAVSEFLQNFCDTARLLHRDRLLPDDFILTAGGSAWFDLVTHILPSGKLPPHCRVILRSGCYLSHDSGWYRRFFEEMVKRSEQPQRLLPGLMPALELWCAVQSVPEPGLALLSCGKRDLPYDIELPVPELLYRPGHSNRPEPLPDSWKISSLNDQHAYLHFPPGEPPRTGDLIALGVSHPCGAFDRWPLIHLVDDDWNTVELIKTFF